MSRMISARVPNALFDQGAVELERLGCTVSELVNAAYEYLLTEHRLPSAKRSQDCERKLTSEQKTYLADYFRTCSLPINIPSDPSYDKKVTHDERTKRYEALA